MTARDPPGRVADHRLRCLKFKGLLLLRITTTLLPPAAAGDPFLNRSGRQAENISLAEITLDTLADALFKLRLDPVDANPQSVERNAERGGQRFPAFDLGMFLVLKIG